MPRNASLACLGLIVARCCLAQPPAPHERATISGTVTSTSGQPLRRAIVHLGPPLIRDSSAEPGTNATAETDSQGIFTFDDVTPGRYSLMAERSGYINVHYHTATSSVLTVTPGEQVTGVQFEMTPQGIIAGRVFDDDNQLLPNATVIISPYSPPSRLANLMFPGIERTTDADGAFAIGGLGPGKYIVSVSTPPLTGPPMKSAGADRPEVYVRTYYPNGTDPASATVLELGSGAQVRGLDIRLQRIAVFKVSGKVVNAATGEPAPADMISLIRRGEGTPGLTARSAGLKAGEFSFDGVLPGDYALETKPLAGSGDAPPTIGWQIISVGSDDLDRVLVEMKPAIEITGKIVVEGEPLESWPQITLTPTEGLNYQDFAPVDDGGTFALSGLEPASYKINVGAVSPPHFVKAVRFNGRELAGQSSIDLASASTASLEIVISDKATGSITGVVTDSSGRAAPGVMVAALNQQVSGRVPTQRTDENGRYTIEHLPPAEYSLIAIDSPGLLLPPVALEKLGKRVILTDGAAVTADLQLPTSDDLRAADSH